MDRFVRKLCCLKAKRNRRPDAKPLRVLIVDDSATVRRRLKTLLSEIPSLEVIDDAADGVEALAVIRGLKPDLVTLDIQMPKMNGLEVLTAMRREGIACRVIVLAGTQGESYREKCLRLGAVSFFDKVRQIEEFLQAVREFGRMEGAY